MVSIYCEFSEFPFTGQRIIDIQQHLQKPVVNFSLINTIKQKCWSPVRSFTRPAVTTLVAFSRNHWLQLILSGPSENTTSCVCHSPYKWEKLNCTVLRRIVSRFVFVKFVLIVWY